MFFARVSTRVMCHDRTSAQAPDQADGVRKEEEEEKEEEEFLVVVRCHYRR